MLGKDLFLLVVVKMAHSLDSSSNSKQNSSSALCSYSFQPLPALNGYMSKKPLLDVTTSTLTECSILCDAHMDCLSFSYEKTSQRCLVHWLSSPELGDPLPGMKTYQLPECRRTCMKGQMHKCTICFEQVTTPLPYHLALQRCRELEGRLWMWKRDAEYQAYKDLVLSDRGLYGDMWIGASDEAKEGTFLWHDGSPADIPWVAFFNEPLGGEPEDCVLYGPALYHISGQAYVSFTFQDTSCDEPRNFMCKFDMY